MPEHMRKAPYEVQLAGAENRSTNNQKEEPMNTIIPENTPPVEFDTTHFVDAHFVDARFVGGTITADIEHFDWIGEDVVRVECAGVYFHFRPHEARDLAAALQALATHIEEEPRKLHRATEPGQPEQNGIGGGL